MNELENELMRKSEIVFDVRANHDFKPSIQSKSKILNLIGAENSDFYKKLLNIGNKVFVYGDKFFAPSKDVFLCIPEEATEEDLNEFIILNNSDKFILEVVRKYKDAVKNNRFSDYFEIV